MTDPHIRRARRLRQTSTSAEQKLWAILRGRGLEGLKFRRQVPLGDYVVDFACLERRLVIEVDGGIHYAPIYDHARQAERDLWLARRGFTILRFRNSDVELPHRVIARILEVGRADTPHPAAPRPPSPARGEGNLG